jgi:ribosomal subunit interface protein
MDIIIQSIGFTASDLLEQFVREKLSKVDHHVHNIMRADVTLSKGPKAELRNNYCEIRLVVPGYDHFAEKNSTSFEHAITECIDALHHMIERAKDKELSSER